MCEWVFLYIGVFLYASAHLFLTWSRPPQLLTAPSPTCETNFTLGAGSKMNRHKLWGLFYISDYANTTHRHTLASPVSKGSPLPITDKHLHHRVCLLCLTAWCRMNITLMFCSTKRPNFIDVKARLHWSLKVGVCGRCFYVHFLMMYRCELAVNL